MGASWAKRREIVHAQSKTEHESSDRLPHGCIPELLRVGQRPQFAFRAFVFDGKRPSYWYSYVPLRKCWLHLHGRRSSRCRMNAQSKSQPFDIMHPTGHSRRGAVEERTCGSNRHASAATPSRPTRLSGRRRTRPGERHLLVAKGE